MASASTAAGLDPLPTSMLDFLGRSAATISLAGIPNPIYSFSPYDPGYGGGGAGYGAYVNLVFYSDGTWVADRYNASNYYGNWYSPTTAGIGNFGWIRFTRTYDGTTSYGEYSTPSTGWLSLSSYQQIQCVLDASVSTVFTNIYTIELSTTSNGSNIVASRSGLEITCEVS